MVKRKTQEEFVSEINKLNPNIEVLSKYINAHTNIKFRCKICGYIYIADELPPDFVCPICKHGADDFEKII